MKTTYVCEITQVSFDNAEECAAHEQTYRDRDETFKKNVDLAVEEIEKVYGVKVLRDTVSAKNGVTFDYFDNAHDYTYIQFTYEKDGKEFMYSVDSDPVGDNRYEWYGGNTVEGIVNAFYVETEGNVPLYLEGLVMNDGGKLTVDDVDLVDLFTLLKGRHVSIHVPEDSVKDVDMSAHAYEDDPINISDTEVLETLRRAVNRNVYK